MDYSRFLEPIPGDDPCGKKMDEDYRYPGLEGMLRGERSDEIQSASEDSPSEPDINGWREIRQIATELLGEGKELRLAVYLALCGLQLEGFPGFRDGLQLIDGLIEKFWENIHPARDPEYPEEDDYLTERANIMLCLACTPQVDEPYKVPLRIKKAPLVSSRVQNCSYSLYDAERAQNAVDGAPTMAQIEAAFLEAKEANPEEMERIEARYQAALEAKELVVRLDGTLGENLGEKAPSLKPALEALDGVVAVMQPILHPEEVAPESDEETAEAVATGGAPAQKIQGEISSHADVIKVIDKICAWYLKAEPASPVPLILKRAQGLVGKSFQYILRDVASTGVSQAEELSGVSFDEDDDE